MRVALIASPAWANWAPHPALLLLGAQLRSAGYTADLYDLNVDSYNEVNDDFKSWWLDENSVNWEQGSIFSRLWDENIQFFENYVKRIAETNPDMIGFCVNSGSSLSSPAVARLARKLMPDVPIVFGGPDCFRSEKFTKHMIPGVVDALCPGEGDNAIIDVVRAIQETGGIPVDLNGFVTWEDGELRDNGDPLRPKNLDDVAIVDLEGVDLSKYQEGNRVTISISRGCIKRCAFCSEGPNFHKFRTHSAAWMIAQLKQLLPAIEKSAGRTPHINFNDSLINGNISVLEELCDSIIENKLEFTWGGMAIIRPEMTHEFMQKMYKAGCREICWGIESGSSRVLNLMRKNLAISLVDEVMRAAAAAGLAQYGNIIIGFPGEGPFEFAESLFFAAKNRSYFSSLGLPIFTPIKNSTVFKLPERFGMASLDHANWHTKDDTNTPEIRLFRRRLIAGLIAEKAFDQGRFNYLSDTYKEVISSQVVVKELYDIASSFYDMLFSYFKEGMPFDFKKSELLQKDVGQLQEQEVVEIYDSFLNAMAAFRHYCEGHRDSLPLIPDRVEDGEIRPQISRGKKKIFPIISDTSPQQAVPSQWVTVGHHQPKELTAKNVYQEQKLTTINSFLDFAKGEGTPEYPVELFLEVSNVCNLKCAMCPTFSGLSKIRYLTLKEDERGFLDINKSKVALDEVLKHTLQVHCFGYGEPTVHPEFKEFIEFLASYEVMIDFFSNGMNFTDELCELLVKNRVASVTISLSGTTKEEYENVYIGGVYENVLEGLKRLSNMKKIHSSAYPRIEVNSLSFEHHVKKLPEFIDIMADNGVNVVHVKSLQLHDHMPQLAGHKAVYRRWIEGNILKEAYQRAERRGLILSANQFESSAVTSDMEWQLERSRTCSGAINSVDNNDIIPLVELKKKAKDVKPLRNGRAPSVQENVMNVAESEARELLQIGEHKEASKRSFHCLEPFKTMYVRKDGAVKPCCFSSNYAPFFGDINSDSLENVWRGAGFSLTRDAILSGEYPTKHCKFCLNNNIGPSHHYTDATFRDYAAWYKAAYGVDMLAEFESKLSMLDDNNVIVARQNGLLDSPAPFSGKGLAQDLYHEVNAKLQIGEGVSHLVEGYLDKISNGTMYGWVWSPVQPADRLDVLIMHEDICIGKVSASLYREDLEKAQKGDGRYGFSFNLPSRFLDGKEYTLNAKLEGCEFNLRGPGIQYRHPC